MKESSFFSRYKEIILGLIILAVGIIYLCLAGGIKVRSSVSVSARMIPEILGWLVIGLGILQLIAGIRFLVKEQAILAHAKKVFMTATEIRGLFPICATFILIILYAALFEFLGFILASALYMFIMMLIMTPRSKNQPHIFLGISLLTAVAVYVAFRHGLNLSLPQGLLESLPF